jgi:signal transduction histidine kinase
MSYPRPEPRPLPTYPVTASGGARPPGVPLTQRLRRGHWVAIDCAVAAFVTLVSTISVLHVSHVSRALLPLALTIAAVVFASIGLRRRAPATAFGALLILGVLLAGGSFVSPALIFLAVAYVLYTVTVTSSKRTGAAALGLVLAVMVVLASFSHPGRTRGAEASDFVPVGLANVIAWMTGYSVRQRRLYVVTLQQQAASSAVAGERLRIARELHDVVAHSMSVIAVQAGYGQYVIDVSPDGARDALGAIQATSRDALDEMRRMLGVLRQQDTPPGAAAPRQRPGGAGRAAGGAGAAEREAAPIARFPAGSGPAPLAPAPGLDDLDRLIRRTCGAGVQVSLERYGLVRAVPAGVDLSAYRIIQEALTNVVKHAGTGAACTVSVGYSDWALNVSVTDDGGRRGTLGQVGGAVPAYLPAYPVSVGPVSVGPVSVGTDGRGVFTGSPGGVFTGSPEGFGGPCADDTVGAGHGIIGMRERVSLCGGTFSAGPLPDGGFGVSATLPLLTADAEGGTVG